MGIMSLTIRDQTGFEIRLSEDKKTWYMQLDNVSIGNDKELTKAALLWYIDDLKALAAKMKDSE